MIFKSLTTRVIVISILLLVFGISTFAFVTLRREQMQLIDAARESSELLLNTIERSTYNSMRIGNTEDVQTILELVGQNQKLLSVRIFHPHGVVLKSSQPNEVGKPVDDRDYQLFINNRKEGVFYLEGHGEVLGMLKPIYNDEPCHVCHGHKSRIIGLLNVNYSLVETRRRIVDASKLFVFSTIAIISFLSLAISMVMVKFVKKPLHRLAENMSRVEQGDLSVRMKPDGKDEIGRLIVSFDSMVDRLDTAKQELDQYHFQQMERADRLASVGEMAAGIAHEIKNPLTGIAAAITIIKEDFAPSDSRTTIVDEVLEQIKRLDKTVNDLLFFGKPAQPEPAFTDINSTIRKTLKFASQHRGSKNIEKKLELQEDLPPVYVDPKQIQQVLLNLFLNAMQAMHDGGTLTIRSAFEKKEQDWVLIMVKDTGQGIPAQILEKIFTPFFTTKAQGTGLGLAICHKLVSQHNGTLTVSSEDGKGTEFIVSLPALSLQFPENQALETAAAI
ncbi:two-component system sensor histidine kinase NtrB [Geotalea toluenoxydans]|uniref:two-component system sensor histidine kinase NtrB n=1 Tax=Geotalea toluenoxydans TaxID=421624 RepID=UPI0006D04B48|nr:ATP-binding protein [Geotalea toluenoxydans]